MIIHVDMDAFYASVEIRDRPELAGRPVVVGGAPEGRGVVAAASYEARRFGIRSAMPMARARRLCPELVILPVRMGYYGEVSARIRAVFERYTPLIEPLSLDEAFLDVRASRRLFGSAVDIARRIQQEIADELRLGASVGVAANKFLAKIASDLRKPGGFVVVEPGTEQAFLDPLPVARLWGVGRATEEVLHAEGIATIADLRRCSEAFLAQRLGKSGARLRALAHGIDDRAVVPEREAKSVSHETTFEADITDRSLLKDWLRFLTEAVAERLRRGGLCARTVFIKVRYDDFTTLTRAHTLEQGTHTTEALWQAARALFERRLPRTLPPVRLLGVGASGLETPQPEQGDLFDTPERARARALDDAADRIRARFGSTALRRGVAPKAH